MPEPELLKPDELLRLLNIGLGSLVVYLIHRGIKRISDIFGRVDKLERWRIRVDDHLKLPPNHDD